MKWAQGWWADSCRDEREWYVFFAAWLALVAVALIVGAVTS